MIITNDFKERRTKHIKYSKLSDKKAIIDKLPTNFDSTAIELNIATESYLNFTDKSPVTTLGDKAIKL